MCSFKLPILVVLAYAGYAAAAAKPISFEEIGRKLHSFGQKAIPAVRGVCGFVNGYQGNPQQYYPLYPQGIPQGYPQGYPQRFPQGYPQFPQQYPQFPEQYPQNYPQIPNQNSNPNTPETFPEEKKLTPSETALEQEDMIKFNTESKVNIPAPEIQDILKKWDKLPKFNPSNVRNEANNFL